MGEPSSVDDPVDHQHQSDSLDLIWGAKAIGEYINANPRQTYYYLETGKLPAQKIGNLWVASRKALRRHFLGGEGA